ncbi:MAG: GNAT family N-acetyltransferase [Planctomycetota bacterium]
MIRYERIDTGHPLYPAECRLRELVLLSPIGYDMDRFQREYPGFEDASTHFVAVLETPGGDRVIGCALLSDQTEQPGVGKLMQMAVHPQRQGEGIGRRLVIEVERHAFVEVSLGAVYCHAQLPAIPFYERLGWIEDSGVFQEAGIPHRRMRLNRPEADPAPHPVPDW